MLHRGYRIYCVKAILFRFNCHSCGQFTAEPSSQLINMFFFLLIYTLICRRYNSRLFHILPGPVGNTATFSRRRRRTTWSLSPSTSPDVQPLRGAARPPAQTPDTEPVLHSFGCKLNDSGAPHVLRGWRSRGQTPNRNPMGWGPEPRCGSAQCSPTLRLLQLQTQQTSVSRRSLCIFLPCIYTLHVPLPGRTSRS